MGAENPQHDQRPVGPVSPLPDVDRLDPPQRLAVGIDDLPPEPSLLNLCLGHPFWPNRAEDEANGIGLRIARRCGR